MKNFNTFTFFNQLTAMPKRLAMVLIVLFTLGVGSMLGETIDFESTTTTYSNWTFTNMTSKQSGTITAKGGSYYGTTGGKSTASIQTKEKIASPSSLSCYISKQSNNTTSSTWYIQTSTTGSSWTDVKTQSATSMSKGSWVEFTADLSSYTDVYVRIYYSGSTAVRNIDNLVLESTNSNCTEPEITFSDGTYTVGASALDLSTLFTSNSNGAVTYSVTNANSTNATISGNKFTATAAGSATVTATQAAAGTYCDGSATATITVKKQQTTITLSEAGQTSNPTGTFYVGDLYQLPATTSQTCGDKTFVGWSTVEIDNSAEKPTSNFHEQGAFVTLEATNTFYAVFAETGGTPTTSWSKTDIANIKSTDEVAITMSKGESMWALSSSKGTDAAPDAILVEQGNLEFAGALLWNIQNDEGDLTIYPNGTSSKWLYCTNTNNGVRVGTNANKTFTIYGNYLKNTATSRYVGVYTTNPDWRCYDNTTGNIAGQTLAFYKKTTTGGYKNYTTECSTPTEFTVSFDANSHGTAPDEQIVASGQKATEPTPAPTATGYTFGGWYKDQTCSNDKKFDFDTPITEDITLYAKWTAIQTTITLNANGGSGNTTSVAATYDSSTLNPSSITNPTKTGHTFGGWYSGEGGTGSLVINSSGKLQANVSGFTGTNGVWKATTNKTLYAKWTPAVYAINYKDQGGANFSGQHEAGYPQNHTYNTATTLKSASKNHYTFDGWYKENDCSGTAVTTLGATEYTDNITLYAKWTAKTYTITLDANGGTFVDNRDSQTKGSATFDYIYGTYANYNDAPNLTEYYSDLKRDGYQFDKWVSAGSPWKKLFTSTGDRTIQAQWSKLYTITLSENGTTTEPTTQTSTTYKLPAELTAGSCQDDTKELVGWSTVAISNPGDMPTSKFYELGETVTLSEDKTTFYAVFATPTTIPGGTEEKEETTTLNFSAQGYGNGEEVTSLTIDDVTVAFNKGTNSNVPKYYNTGTAVRVYGGGYFTVTVPNESSISTIALTFGSGDESNTITTNSNTYSNGTWTGSAQSVKFTVGGTTGHRRIKSVKVTYTTTVHADDIVTYSKYSTTCVPTYKITYDFAGGEGECTTDIVEKDTEYTLCSTPPTKAGHTFLKWKDQNDYEYKAGDKITSVKKDLTLTAQWQVNSYEVTWMSLGDEVLVNKADYNTQPTKPATDPTYTCSIGTKEFVGWSTQEIDGAGVPANLYTDEFPVVTEAITYHAVFASKIEGGGSMSKAVSLTNGETVYLATESGIGVTGANTSTNKDATVSTTQGDWMPFTVVTNGLQYQFKNGDNYITAAAKSFKITERPSDFAFENGYIVYNVPSGSDAGDYVLLVNNNDAINTYYRFYKESNMSNSKYETFYVYKNPTHTDYTTSCPVLELTEGENTLADGVTADVKVNRSFTTGNLYTISLPFALDAAQVNDIFGIGTALYQFAQLAKEGKELVLYFSKPSAIAAATPYLIAPAQNVTAGFIVEDATISTTPHNISFTVGATTVTMKPILSATAGEKTNGTTEYWLAEDTWLYNNENTLLSLRALFNISTVSGMPPRCRVALGENVETGIDNLTSGENTTIKLIENGQLIIIRNGEKFNAQGIKF